jgi:hypothetical protein
MSKIQSHLKLRVLCTDRGDVFTVTEFIVYYMTDGVYCQHTTPYKSVAERRRRAPEWHGGGNRQEHAQCQAPCAGMAWWWQPLGACSMPSALQGCEYRCVCAEQLSDEERGRHDPIRGVAQEEAGGAPPQDI